MGRKSQTKENKSTVSDTGGHPRRLAVVVIDSVTSFWALCSKQATKTSRKLKNNSRIMPKSPKSPSPSPSPLTERPKKILATLSNKAIKLRQKKGGRKRKEEELEFGDDGVWQREILMGDKCQPLDFSGVIYYDKEGKRMSELPARSPRASPLHQYAYASGKSDW